MAAVGERQEEKSTRIIAHILALDMFDLVDGKKENWKFTKWIKKTIQKVILKKSYIKKITRFFLTLFIVASLSSFVTFICGVASLAKVTFWVSIFALIIWVSIIIILLYLKRKLKKLTQGGYGLNEGNFFYTWLSKILHGHGITNLHDLKQSFDKCPASLQVRKDEQRDKGVEGMVTPPTNPMIVIVASDVTTGNKIEFPRMWNMYWDNPADVPPAAFVRASMSIPIFYETYKLNISDGLVGVTDSWKDHINWSGKIPECVQFVDGGALSNFPINVFYNRKFIIPRMPTFGVRLGDDGEQVANKLETIQDYLGSMLSTIRGTIDKGFMNRYKAFNQGISMVDMGELSWLNFFMSEEEKMELFRKGAEAAASFILTFNWSEYKSERYNNHLVLEKQEENPNNW